MYTVSRLSLLTGGVIMEGKILVNVGVQRFDRIREQKAFYIDKTDFIRE